MASCLIALGSNLGDRLAQLEGALTELARRTGSRVVARSVWHGTAPAGGVAGQEEFLNGAAVLETTLAPDALLAALHEVEQHFGRTRTARWGPRTLDLDLLLYDEAVIDSPQLQVPHPRLAFRRFVLEPAVEIAPDWLHPRIGWTLAQCLESINRAPTYIAVTGENVERTRELARRAAALADARLLSDAVDCRADLVELEHQQAWREQCLAIDRWLSDDRPIVSDFWAEDRAPFAVAHCPAEAAERFARRVRDAQAALQRPTLVMVVREPGSPSGWWREVEESAFRSGRGPALRVDGGRPDVVIDEIVAAVRAAQRPRFPSC